MNIKRILTALIGLPVVVLIFVFGNKYIIDIIMSVIAMIAIHEYFKCVNKEVKGIAWIGYLLAISIAFLHIINLEMLLVFLIIGIPTILLILFFHIIATNMKINLKDIAFSFLGICYIIFFIVFIPLIYGMGDKNIQIDIADKNTGIFETFQNTLLNGKFLIWYLMWNSWGSDVFAYLIGRHFGKHKFSKVSPNKTIEGCTAGVIGAVALSLGYTYALNNFAGFSINYLTITIISIVLCLVGQIGDFAASTIKRYFEVKDFSEIFPGHGGMIDRIDSVIFIAPYAFCLFSFLL